MGRIGTAAVLRRGLAAVVATSALVLGLLVGAPVPSGSAAPAAETAAQAKTITGANWMAGDIISDGLFYDKGAMTAAEIQTFLNAKIGTCTNGKCLNVIRISPASQPVKIGSTTGNLICAAVTGGTMSVATWIYRVQIACGVSAKVILATLQKEQGLVTKKAPTDGALAYAMGWACPDTGGCAPGAAGLAVQLYKGARQLVTYKKDRFSKQPGVQTILWSPKAGCGGATVNVKNYATAALYAYTPYQPNAAALANLTGTGNTCSSYGNRNFWYFYSTWFGSTHGAAFGWLDSGSGMLATTATGTLQLWGGNGKGGWKASSDLGTGWDAFTHVQGAGDLDGDGHRDVIGVDSAGALWYSPSDGLAELQPAVKIADGWGGYTDVLAPGDFNGDGKADLLTRDGAGALVLHPGDGLGGLRAAVPVATGWGSYTKLVTPGDFYRDGKVDLIARDAAGKLLLFRGTGAGTVAAPMQIGTGWGGFDTIIGVGDFTGDKKADLLTRLSTGVLKVYPGNGSGGFLSAKDVGHGFGSFTAFGGVGAMPTAPLTIKAGVGDLKFDGHRDVLARDATGALFVYPGTGAKFGSRIAVSGDFTGMTAIFGADDFDRDGSTDVMMRDAAGVLWSYPSNRAGGFGTREQVATGWDVYTAVVGPGDVTSDRKSDLITRDSTGLLWLFEGDGAGGLAAPRQVGSGWTNLSIVTPGDFDGDRVGDLITIDAAGAMRLYGGNGVGGWRTPVQIGSGWGAMTAVFSPGDFSGDGNPDVLARDASGKFWLYRGTGGGFLARIQVGSGWQSFTSIG